MDGVEVISVAEAIAWLAEQTGEQPSEVTVEPITVEEAIEAIG